MQLRHELADVFAIDMNTDVFFGRFRHHFNVKCYNFQAQAVYNRNYLFQPLSVTTTGNFNAAARNTEPKNRVDNLLQEVIGGYDTDHPAILANN